jgi:hypothetical protein
MEKNIRKAIRAMVKEEMINMMPIHHDHEAKMAKSELRDMIKLGAELYNMIQEGDNLPGWTSAYITLASDYIHSVHQYMTENNT